MPADPQAKTPAATAPARTEPAPDAREADASPAASSAPTDPLPWTSWPLENLDFERYAGWRIDATHGGFEREPGLVLACKRGDFVLAIAAGEVAAVERNTEDELELVIDHEQGISSHYGPLEDALVHAELPVDRGVAIGLCARESLRLRVTVSGVDIDPLLALRQPLHRWPGLL